MSGSAWKLLRELDRQHEPREFPESTARRASSPRRKLVFPADEFSGCDSVEVIDGFKAMRLMRRFNQDGLEALMSQPRGVTQ